MILLLAIITLLSYIIVPISAKGELILSPYIKENRISEARNASKVDPKLFLGVESHSGFLTVDEKYNANLFFWYFPVAEKPVNVTPWIIWLQGGPGSTSLYGLFDEIGPFEYTKELKLREWSWGKEYSLLFIDNPVGTGFSFVGDNRGLATNMATYSQHLYTGVQQFLTIFPELRKAPLYIAGESYAGRYIPGLANEVYKHNSDDINLQGLMMGNPVLERESIVNLSSAFYHWGLIDDQGLDSAKPFQNAYRDAVIDEDYVKANDAREDLLNHLERLSASKQLYNVLKDEMNLIGFFKFLNNDVKKAIHVQDEDGGPHKIIFSNAAVKDALLPDYLVHTQPIIEKLLDKYRILIYCGQLDLVSPCTLNASPRRKSWRWTNKTYFMEAQRIPWVYNGSIAGYVKSGGGLTEVLVRGAGHIVPMDKPAVTFSMAHHFINNISFPPDSLFDPTVPLKEFEIAQVPEVEEQTSAVNVIMILSLIFNGLLITAFCIWFVRRRLKERRRNETWLYNVVDDRLESTVLEIN